MKTERILIAIIVLFTAAAFAQNDISLAPYAGYTMSLFEEQDKSVGAPLLGFMLGYEVFPGVEAGGELNYAIGGFAFERESEDLGMVKQTWEQLMIGAYGKFTINASFLKPYAKVGVGYYVGDFTVEEGGDKISLEWDNGIGFRFGGGILFDIGIFAEFDYNIVTRSNFGMNTWAILAGVQFIK
jgi:hypothetical protein